MEKIRETEKRYASLAMIISLIVGFVLIVANFKSEGKGLILGAIFSCINFVLIGEAVPSIINKEKRKRIFFSLSSMALRYLILAFPLILGVKYETFDFCFVVIGIFSVQLLLVAEKIFKKDKNTAI
ncbi:MAG: ATP synthase subunit I [Deltaproteobacteria bacterium]|nr:ATP synthase subunit I [Deltaproteobacteria bacterium]